MNASIDTASLSASDTVYADDIQGDDSILAEIVGALRVRGLDLEEQADGDYLVVAVQD